MFEDSSRCRASRSRNSAGSQLLTASTFFITLTALHARVFDDVVVSDNQNWVYLDQFVFDTTGKGTVSYEIQLLTSNGSPAQSANISSCFQVDSRTNGVSIVPCNGENISLAELLFYPDLDDSLNSWLAIYNDNSLTCEDRTAKATLRVPLDGGIVERGLIPTAPFARPRFWYTVLSWCSQKGIRASVRLEFLNSQVAPLYSNVQFSFDELGLFDTSCAFCSTYSFGVGVVVYIVWRLMVAGVMHDIHWIFVASYVCYTISSAMYFIHYSKYSQDGMGYDWVTVFARCFEIVGFIIYVNAVLLIARGWTITTNKLSRTVEHAVISGFIVLIYIALFFADILRDPAQSFYLYDSWPGYVFVAMHCFLLVLFWFLLRRTYIFEKRIVKRVFYRRIGVLFSLWFLQLPLFVAVAQNIMPWYLTKTMYGLEWTVQMVAFILLPVVATQARQVFDSQKNFQRRIPSVARQLQVQPSVTATTGFPDILNGMGRDGVMREGKPSDSDAVQRAPAPGSGPPGAGEGERSLMYQPGPARPTAENMEITS